MWIWLRHYYWQFYHCTIPTVSLLDHHNCPERSSLARKHKVKTNLAPDEANKVSNTRQQQHYYTDSSTTMIAILFISLLDGLKCAQRSSLARKRKVKTNLLPVGARNSQRHMPTWTLLLTVLWLRQPIVSLLDHPKCAEWSSLARKRKVKTNSTPVWAKKKRPLTHANDNNTHRLVIHAPLSL